MGRLEFLRRTLPSVLQNLGCRYCLVDYSCPDECGAWVASNYASHCADRRIVVRSVAGRSTFHKAEALNQGARFAIGQGARYLCFLDADTLVHPGCGGFVHSNLGSRQFLVELYSRSLFGFLVVPAVAFQATQGFDEAIRGYGGEDIELRLRLCLLERLQYFRVPLGLLSGLAHDATLRTRFYDERDLALTNQQNLAYVRAKVKNWTGRELHDLDENVLCLYRRQAGPYRPPVTLRSMRRRYREATGGS